MSNNMHFGLKQMNKAIRNHSDKHIGADVPGAGGGVLRLRCADAQMRARAMKQDHHIPADAAIAVKRLK